MNNSGLVPKSIRRADGVMTIVYVKPDDAGMDVRDVRKIPAVVASAAPIEKESDVTDNQNFPSGSVMSLAEHYRNAPMNTMVKLHKTSDVTIKKSDGKWYWIDMPDDIGRAGDTYLGFGRVI